MAADTSQSLAAALAAQLPLDHEFIVHHISTPPTRCDPIYSPPPNTRPDQTYRESHFLQVSVPASDNGGSVFVLAIECLIYSTRYLTTIFISKADSTGYLSIAKLDKGHESPLRTVATTFVSYLVKHRLRPGVKLVVDLFARASDQYLYPGSVENAQKHVSDDRQLVKWWCRVLNPIVQSYAKEPVPKNLFEKETDHDQQMEQVTAQAYLLVPGEEFSHHFLPTKTRLKANELMRWTHGHPLATLSRHAGAPPRCLIPHFPDDPKGRYLVELDDELPDANALTAGTQDASPSKRGNGEWKSVRSLDRFWEMMAFRSECSSGRLVGFIWLVFTPPSIPTEITFAVDKDNDNDNSQKSGVSGTDAQSPPPRKPKPTRTPKTGTIPPLLPRILRTGASNFAHLPATTPWYLWPARSRAPLVLADSAYAKATDMLLRLDFATLPLAAQSTRAWVQQVGVLAGWPGGDVGGGGGGNAGVGWGTRILGCAAPPVGKSVQADTGSADAGAAAHETVHVLGVKRKRVAPVSAVAGGDAVADAGMGTAGQTTETHHDPSPLVNVLGVRKKPKRLEPQPVSSA